MFRESIFHNKIMGILAAQRGEVEDDAATSAYSSENKSKTHSRAKTYQDENILSWRETIKLSLIGLIVLFPAFLIVATSFVAIVALMLWLWT